MRAACRSRGLRALTPVARGDPLATSAPIIATRLVLTPFASRHLTSTYVAWLNDPEVVRFSDRSRQRHTLESCARYWRSFDGTPNHFWAIETLGDGKRHIGNLTAHLFPEDGVADLGILIGARDAWGMGFGKEAWRAACAWLFEMPGVRKITAGTLSTNSAMLGLMRATGMSEDGVRRAHRIWHGQVVDVHYRALFRDAWPPGPGGTA